MSLHEEDKYEESVAFASGMSVATGTPRTLALSKRSYHLCVRRNLKEGTRVRAFSSPTSIAYT